MLRSPVRVFICDPHPATLHGIQDFLDRARGFTVVGASTDPAGCLAAPDDPGPVVYVIDQEPADVYDPGLIQGLVDTDPTRRIVVYSAHDRVAVVASMYTAGASAFVHKRTPMDALLEAIEVVAGHAEARDRHYPENLATVLADFYSAGGGAAGSPQRLLSPRQLEIYVLLAEGYSQRDVAARLGMNRRTVSNQVGMIRRKLKIPDEHFRSYAIEYGLVDPLRAPRAFPSVAGAPQDPAPATK